MMNLNVNLFDYVFVFSFCSRSDDPPAVLFDLIEVAYNDAQVRKSFTAMTVIGLIRAQHYMDYDWCMVYEQTDVLRQNQSSFKMDLSKEAYSDVFEYMDLYADYCYTEIDENF